jgi:predicted amidophosphoribosyltransferase
VKGPTADAPVAISVCPTCGRALVCAAEVCARCELAVDEVLAALRALPPPAGTTTLPSGAIYDHRLGRFRCWVPGAV